LKNSKKKTGKTPASSDTRRLVVISDLHAGSSFAPCPPNYQRHDGNIVYQNTDGQFATAAFQTFTKTILQLPSYDLLLNGDLIQGFHPRSKEVWSMDPGDHVGAAMMLLDPLVNKATRVWVTAGTESHSQESEQGLAMYFGANRDKYTKKLAPNLWRFTYCGVMMHAIHHMPTTVRVNLEATQLSVQLREHQIKCVQVDLQPPRLVIASHRHTAASYTDFHSMMLVTPAWQTADGRYTQKVVPGAQTRVGGLMLDWTERLDGELPLVHPYIYAPEKE
jgi:hypothetical protein